MTWVWVVAAGAAGTAARYSISLIVGPREFPWATLGINVAGSFLIAVVLTLGAAHHLSPELTTPLTVGLIGGFTTYSTFAFETFTLGHTSHMLMALLYVTLSVALGWTAAALGYALAISLINSTA